ncbi:MAG: Hemolysins and related proteins containing CBS domains [uncultured Thermomicrobiales bacterium]|uniref:Hemolysins and related proteins containing CBS domains n=1 Tax=uncultured Thermomicrobiales bacterium TaxID=1645740 RepID=A0A6J4TU29_9BACT|nr:MAG: Hemolysins and related proteins containing CBS domains [uncultured Thermomicrobiales bacterium]
MRVTFEIVVVLLLIVANGLFSLAETSVVSSRKSRLQQRAGGGDAAAGRALALAEDPNVFLATVQVGITLIGILSGALGGATVARSLADLLDGVPGVGRYADTVALVLVVLVITYLSLVVGELVPKRIALNNPEGVAARVSGPMRGLSAVTSPVVGLLGASTDAVLRLLGVRPSGEPPVTEAEVGVLLEQGAQAGVFDPAERAMVGRVFALADDRVAALMTPRPAVVWLDLDDPPEAQRRTMAESVFSRFPVGRGDLDHVVGVVRAKDLLADSLTGRPVAPEERLRPPLVVPEGLSALRLLEGFRQAGEHLALVVDEYGGTAGLVTIEDVLEAIVGDLPSTGEPGDAGAVRRDDGSWLLDGALPIARFADVLESAPPPEEDGDYETLGGFVLARLGRIPAAGTRFDWEGWRFEVVDMDGNRVDKVLATATSGAGVTGSTAEDATDGPS